MHLLTQAAITALLLHSQNIAAQDCSVNLRSSYPAPVVASGYSARLIAGGLSRPRGILFDQNKNLLVVEQGTGIKHITFSSDDRGTCIALGNTKNLINNQDLLHGIELSRDGKTLYASSSDKVFSWAYDADAGTASDQRTLIQNMTNPDHVTRTLLLSHKQPDLLLVSRGSSSNLDDLAAQESSGISQLRAFNLSALGPSRIYNYPTDGFSLGWGLRNSVGVVEHPVTGGIYSIENSADDIRRKGQDIHQDNPGEELNFHGFLNSTEPRGNYGYPHCFTLWATDIPDRGSVEVGNQFSLYSDGVDSPIGDAECARDFVAPRLAFQAHTAPLDIKFDGKGETAYVTLHGSWNRDQPAGYKLVSLAFRNGEPTEPSTSTTAAVDILTNQDMSRCPGNCFRPVGLAVDDSGRVFMTSDSTGEIYVIQKGGNGGNGIGNENSAGRTLVGVGIAMVVVLGCMVLA